MKSKKGIEMNFTLILAMIAGAMILILAVYGVTRFSETKKLQTEAEAAKELAILTDPLQAGYASGSAGKITFVQEARIRNKCYSDGFGRQELTVQLRSSNEQQFMTTSVPVSVHNKYIFSSLENGTTFFLFSKPFELPFEISDLTFMTSKNYCFVEPPEKMKNELGGLAMKNIFIYNSSNKSSCPANAAKVCFGGRDCDISVLGTCSSAFCDSAYDEGYTKKDGSVLNYYGSLIYGTIFADEDVYECNVKRLMYRMSRIADVFMQKAELMNARGCNTNIGQDLELLKQMTQNATSKDLALIASMAADIQNKNDQEQCAVW